MNMKFKSEHLILIAFGISGMTALIYEVAWTRLLVLIFGSTVYAVSTMLTAFMAGLALGSYWIGKNINNIKNHRLIFGLAELGIGLYVILFPLLLINVQYLYFVMFQFLNQSFVLFQIAQLILFFLLLLFPTFLMGATFPLVSKITIDSFENAAAKASQAYAINTLGSVVGPVIGGFALIPVIGVRNTMLFAALINIIIALVIIWNSKYKVKLALAMPGLLAFIFYFYFLFQTPLNFINFYYIKDIPSLGSIDQILSSRENLFYKEGEYATVQVTKTPPDIISLGIDGRIDASTSNLDMSTQLLLTYIPMLLTKNNSKVLDIGLGGGFTAGTLKNFDSDIDVVEIDSAVVDADKYFSSSNNNALDNKRLNLTINDARNFLFLTDKKYNVIISEPSHPITSSVNHLFTKEFFKLVGNHLSDDGIFAQWLPTNRIGVESYKIVLKTLLSEFPYVTVWNSSTFEGADTIFIASYNPYNFKVNSIDFAKNDLERINIDSAEKFNSLLLLDFNQSRDFVKDVNVLNTDDFPIIEFSIPRTIFGD